MILSAKIHIVLYFAWLNQSLVVLQLDSENLDNPPCEYQIVQGS